ncbi:MAG TPA: ATP-grasp domain-containing protein [Acidobacteriota bacterium]|nr:ATP-grasp domain-containing protein [Acidobacteriota bacterium]
MKVVMISPGFPAEMPFFTAGLAGCGAQVLGIGDQPVQALPELARSHLAAYRQVNSLWDENEVAQAIAGFQTFIDRIECPWEPGVLMAARLRERFHIEGMREAETVPFRDKERMKQVLDEAGIRTPRHARASTAEEVREAAERIGYPLIVKPIAGAGSADTHRLDDSRQLEEVLSAIGHVKEVSVEEFIEGDEYTFDTICADGKILYFNIAWYRPRPLIARTVQWISPQTIALRDVDAPHLASGRRMGQAVIQALGFRSGFTHMEWFLKPDGEAVFGEIGCRPPGARSVDIMNWAGDIDLYRGWAEAVCLGRLGQEVRRRYNAAVIFKRAQGQGRIQRVEGLQRLLSEIGQHVVNIDLLPVGAPRRDWKQTLLSDGWVTLRHPDLQRTLEMADRVGTDVQMFAG